MRANTRGVPRAKSIAVCSFPLDRQCACGRIRRYLHAPPFPPHLRCCQVTHQEKQRKMKRPLPIHHSGCTKKNKNKKRGRGTDCGKCLDGVRDHVRDGRQGSPVMPVSRSKTGAEGGRAGKSASSHQSKPTSPLSSSVSTSLLYRPPKVHVRTVAVPQQAWRSLKSTAQQYPGTFSRGCSSPSHVTKLAKSGAVEPEAPLWKMGLSVITTRPSNAHLLFSQVGQLAQ